MRLVAESGAFKIGENKMKMSRVFFAILSVFFALTMTGCNKARLQSLGANPVPTFHTPRGTDSETGTIAVSAEGYVIPLATGRNVDDILGGGGDVALMYRFGGSLSPLFITGAVGGQGGKVHFNCDDETPRCVDSYETWLRSDAGEDSYSFWNVQEKVLLGADFKMGSRVQLGLGGGIQFYQGGGEYEDARDDLDKLGWANNLDEKMDFYPMTATWISVGLGSENRLGNLKLEETYMLASDWTKMIYATDVGYYHPSGFQVGLMLSTQMSPVIHGGKTFVF